MINVVAKGVVALASMALAGGALAADLPLKAPPYVPVRSVTGFYVVVGGSVLLPGSADVNDRNCGNIQSLIPCGIDNSIDGKDGWLVGGAVGYRFSSWFRADLSVGHGQLTASGSRAPAPTELFSPSYHARFTTTGVFLTGYLDIAGLVAPGTFGNFEPFIGAGIGASHAHVDDLYFSNTGFPGVQFVLPDLETTKAAFKLTAGTGIRLTPHWRFDVAYSYYDLGHLETPAGTVVATPAVFPPFPTNGFDVRARSHAVEFGLRYDL